MRIGILEGSLREESLSRSVGRASQAFAPENTEIVLLPSVGELPHYNQDVQDKGMPEVVQAFGAAVEKVDAVLFVSPEYNWSIPGVLKNAIDWLSRLKPNPLQGKPTSIWTVAPGLLGGARAHQSIRQVLASQGMVIMTTPEVQVAGAKGKINVATDEITDDDTAEFLRGHLSKFSEFSARWSN